MIKKQEDQSKIDRITWEGSLTVRTGHHIAHPILCVSPHTIFAVVLWRWIIAWSGPLPFAVTTWFIASIPFSPSSPVPVDGRWNYREEILGCRFSFLAGELLNGRRRDVFRKDLKLPTISQLVTKRRFTPNDLYPVCLMTCTWEVCWDSICSACYNLDPEVCNSIPTIGLWCFCICTGYFTLPASQIPQLWCLNSKLNPKITRTCRLKVCRAQHIDPLSAPPIIKNGKSLWGQAKIISTKYWLLLGPRQRDILDLMIRSFLLSAPCLICWWINEKRVGICELCV